jgi:hypothetical protein
LTAPGYHHLFCCITVGLPGKRAADTDENRNKKLGKGTKYSPANRRPVARDLIIFEAGGAWRMDRRLHGLYTNVLIGYGVLIARSGYQPLLLCERWALRVVHLDTSTGGSS